MEKIWDIGGVYANWRMTVTADPPDDAVEVAIPETSFRRFDALAEHFFEVVCLFENLRADESR